MSYARSLSKLAAFQIRAGADTIPYGVENIPYQIGATNGSTVKAALDWLFAVLYPNTKTAVDTPADLPLEDNEINDYRVVLDDGNGQPAGYRWFKKESDPEPRWYKIFDMQWSSDSILAGLMDKAQFHFVYKDGRMELDHDGNPLTGELAGQHIYGGTDADSHLTLHPNSGDESDQPEDQTGFIQLGGHARPLHDDAFDLGDGTRRFRDLFFTRNLTDGTVWITLDELIDAYNHATSLGNPHETTYDELDERIGTLTVDGDATGSIDLSSSGDKTLTLEVEDDSHYHTSDTISDFDEAVYENLKGALVDGEGYSWEFDDEFEQVELKLDTDLVPMDAPVAGQMLIGSTDETRWEARTTEIELTGDVTGSGSYDTDKGKWVINADVESSSIFGIDGINLEKHLFTSVAGNPTVITSPSHGLKNNEKVTFFGELITTTETVTVIDSSSFSIPLETLEDSEGFFIPHGSQLLWNSTTKEFEVARDGAQVRLGDLDGLDEDVLDQYVNKNGRIGGQVIHGGVSASQNLVLESTSHETKGQVRVASDLTPNDVSGSDLGTTDLPWNDLVMTGVAKGLRAEEVESLPTPSMATKGRVIVYDNSLWINASGTEYVKVGSSDIAVRTVTANETIDKDADVILVNSSAGDVTITLGDTSIRKKPLVIKKIHEDNSVYVVPGSGYIDGESEYELYGLNHAIKLVTNNTGWFII